MIDLPNEVILWAGRLQTAVVRPNSFHHGILEKYPEVPLNAPCKTEQNESKSLMSA